MRQRLVGVCACWAVLLGCLGVFAAGRPSSTEYVTDGLVAHWDAIDNTLVDGVRSHDAAVTTWSDLTGRGSDVTLPSFVTVGADSMYSAAKLDKKPDTDTTATLKYPTFATLGGWTGGADDSPFTVEVVARRGCWTNDFNYYSLQTIFSTPCGAVGYRNNGAENNHFFLSFPDTAAGNLDLMNWSPSASPTDIHTISVDWGTDPAVGSARIDNGGAMKFTSNDSNALSRNAYFSMFSNSRAEIYIHAIRVYNRVLTDAERTQNYQLDQARFTPFEVEPMQTETYTGSAIEPDPVVVNSFTKEPLVKGTDYTVSYANNVRSGFGEVHVTGIGTWAGSSVTASFMIVLPELYRELDYIESTGTQYIDTGYLPNPTTRMEASIMFVGDPANRGGTQPGASYWGCAEEDGQITFSGNFGGGEDQDNYVLAWLDKSYAKGATDYPFTITPEARQSQQTFTVDAASGVVAHGTVTKQAATKTTTHTQHTLCLFGSRGANGVVKPFTYYKLRVYGWKIWDGSTLVRDFVPCYSLVHMKEGFIEKVSGHFYANAGTGTFAYPPLVPREALPADYHPLDYLVATGAQHIATGVMAASDVTVSAEFTPLSSTAGMRVFGAREKGSSELTASDLFFEVYLNSEKKWACCCSNGPQGGNGTDGMWSIGTFSTGVATNQLFTLDSWGNAFCVNNVKQTRLSRDRSGEGTEILLLKAHDSAQGYGRLHSAHIWKAGVLVRRLVPCYRVSDGLTGMYDLVAEAFHPSGGGAPFLHGTGGEMGTPWFGGHVERMGFHAGRSYDVLTKFSFSAWVRNPQVGDYGWDVYKYGVVAAQGALGGTAGFCCFVSKKSSDRTTLSVQLRNVDGKAKSLSIQDQDQHIFSDNEWHHLAFTFDYDAGQAHLYLDGKERAAVTSVDDLVRPGYGGNFSIGARHDGRLAYPYRGEIAHVTLWNRALTAAEVDRLRIHPVMGTESGLLDAWTLSAGSAGTVGLVTQKPLTMVTGDLGFGLDAVKWYVPGMMIIVR